MESKEYERPREKLRHYGVTSLTDSELLQLIIGSGSVRVPVAKMARSVHSLLNSTARPVPYDLLSGIAGVGEATVCRILAALELGERSIKPNETSTGIDVTRIRKARKKTITYVTLDGAGARIGQYEESFQAALSHSIARRICAKALSDTAHALLVIIFNPIKGKEVSLQEASFLTELQDMTRRLGIKLSAIEYVTKTTHYRLHGGSV